MTMKSLVNFCIGVAVVILIGSFLLSAFTPKAPDNAQQMVPVNQAGQVMAQTATAKVLHPATPAPAGTNTPVAVPTPRNASIIEQIVMHLLAPANADAGSSAASGDVSPSTLVSLDQIVASANGKKLDQLFAGATADQKQMIRQYSGGKSDTELVSSFCRDVKSDSFKAMSANVKANSPDPNTDPHSPALLMLLFEKLAALCP